MAGGDLVGIAATERHGGSRLQEITTMATAKPGGGWWLNGEKCWVSRLTESAAFVVFFKDDDDGITAAVVEAKAVGLERGPVVPAGLGGWDWGTLAFTDVHVSEDDLLGGSGGGLEVFRRHFARLQAAGRGDRTGDGRRHAHPGLYHPHGQGRHRAADPVAGHRTGHHRPYTRRDQRCPTGRDRRSEADRFRQSTGRPVVPRGQSACSRCRPPRGPRTPAAGRRGGFRAESALAKARADVGGLLYADGIHDSLLRSAGRALTTPAPRAISKPQPAG